MNEGCREGDLRLMLAEPPKTISVNELPYHLHELTSSVEHAEAVSEAGMGRTWEDKL